jgi:hypothetical protein
MALAYSTWFKRWMGIRPGLGFRAAARSSDVLSQVVKASAEALSGRGMLGGGISPVLTLCNTFSQTSAPLATLSRSIFSSVICAVRSRSLWQTTQFLLRSSRCGEDAAAVLAAGPGEAACGPALRIPSTGA